MDMPVEKKIVFELNGRSVEAIEGETILEAADRIGVEIPRLCYKEGIRADGNCRAVWWKLMMNGHLHLPVAVIPPMV